MENPGVSVFFGIISLLLLYCCWGFSYWRRRNIEFALPIPIFGNILDLFLLRCNIAQKLSNFYRQSRGPIIGIFMLHRPALVVKDPDLMRDLLQKHFDHFPNRSVVDAVDGVGNPDATTGLFVAEYETWKFIRRTIKSHFSFLKLKEMMGKLLGCSDGMINYIRESNENGMINIRNACLRFSLNSVCSLLFGFDGNCFSEDSAVLKIGKTTFDYRIFKRGSQILMAFISPFTARILNLEFFEEKSTKVFINLIMKLVEERKIGTNDDYVGSLLNANFTGRGNLLVGTIETFVAGFEAVSSVLCFAFFELAKNPEVQRKLRKDVEESLQGKNDMTYDEINQIPYLDLFFKELVRKYPLVPFMDRMCSKTITLDGWDLRIEEGICVYVPILALHHDPKYYTNPEHFLPERFLNGINPSAYIPFGLGPRTCLAKKYSQIVIKYCLARLVTTFEFDICSRTPAEIIFNTKGFTLQPAEDVILNVHEIHASI